MTDAEYIELITTRSEQKKSHTEHTTVSGKKIIVWDDLVPSRLQYTFFLYVQNSKYAIGWADDTSEIGAKHKYLHCPLSIEETLQAGIYPFIQTTEINEHLQGYSFEKSVINLSTPSDVNFFHTHDAGLVLLYYVNPVWLSYWHGETLFSDESGREIERAVAFKPGRLVLFDTAISHSIRPQSIAADNYRYTYAMLWRK
jgi:hypothetical protein